MQAEVIALAACCRELIPIIDMVQEVGTAVGLTQSENSKMYVCIHEDNLVRLFWLKLYPLGLIQQANIML